MFITACGMVCPVGFSAASACAAWRAGISAFKDLRVESRGEPIIGAYVPGLNPTLTGSARVLELLARSLSSVIQALPRASWADVPLLVALAEQDRPGGSAHLFATIVRQLQETLGVQFHPRFSKAFPLGHTAGFEALRSARDLLNGGIRTCIIVGADSMLSSRTLTWLDSQFRLRTAANMDGVIPGEAGAAVVVQQDPNSGSCTELIGLGFAREEANILSDKPMLALGLTEATRQALAEAGLGLHEIDCRITDATGESYGFKEISLVSGRLMRSLRRRDQPLWHWADAIGDSGAAAGVVQLVAVDDVFRRDNAGVEKIICWTSSVAGERASAVLRRCGGRIQ